METISLKFKTLKNSGTLLHAEGQRDHSLTLVLEKGKLLLYHLQGRTPISKSYRHKLMLCCVFLHDKHNPNNAESFCKIAVYSDIA